MRKLKIGVICYPSLGGSGVVATELGKKMADRGHELHYIASSTPFRLLEKQHPNIYFHEVTIDGYAVFKYPPYDIALANRISQIIETKELDLLHVHYAVPHAVSATLGKDMANSTIGIITTLHGTDVTILGRDPNLRNTIRYGIRKSAAVTAVSESLKNETMELLEPEIETEIQTIYNFIDEKIYKPTNHSNILKAELGIKQHEKVMIHISNFRKVKNIPDILKSFQKIIQEVDAKLLLVGEGPEKKNLEDLVRQLEIDDHVIFIGKRNDMPQLLAISDVMIHLSQKEAFGLVLLEAFACGVPSVATSVGGIPEVIEDGVNGFLVQSGDVEAAVTKSLTLLQNDHLRMQFGENGRRLVTEKFCSSKIVTEYEKLYYEVAGVK